MSTLSGMESRFCFVNPPSPLLTCCRTPYPIVDRLSRIVAVLAGQPKGNYAEDLMKAHDAMKSESAAAGLGTEAKEGAHIRGRFPAYNCGTTMGMGNPKPVVLRPKNEGLIVYKLLRHEGVIRMARYQDCKLILNLFNP